MYATQAMLTTSTKFDKQRNEAGQPLYKFGQDQVLDWQKFHEQQSSDNAGVTSATVNVSNKECKQSNQPLWSVNLA